MHIKFFRVGQLCLALGIFSSLAACDRHADLSAEQYIERAKDFQSKGDARASILELKNAVQKDPSNAQARWLLGMAYLDLRSGGEAETQLSKAVQLGISPQSARIPLARAHLYQGNFQQLLDSLPAVDTDQQGELTQILDLRATALIGLNKYSEACPLFDRAIQVDKAFAPAYLGRSRCQFHAGQTSAAIDSAKQATVLDPSRLESWYFLGDLFRTLKQPDAALAAYDQALKVKSDDFDALSSKAMTLLSVNRGKEAEAVIQRLGDMRPQAVMSRYLKAYLLHQQGKNNDAASLLQLALKDSPNHPQLHLLYGAVNYAIKNDETALSSFNKVLTTFELPEARLLLAATHLRMGTNDAVVKTLEPLLAQGSNAKAFLLAGQAKLNQGDLDQGMTYLNRASVLDPKNAVIRSTLAQNQLLTGDQQGIGGLEAVITENPNDTRAYLLLAAAQTQKGDYKQALDTLQQMSSSQPSNPLPFVLIGRIHLMQRNPVAARQAFERSLVIKPDFLTAAGALAELDIQEKKPAQARERFKRILASAPQNLGALLGQARISLATGAQDEFVSYSKKAIQTHPTAIEPVSQLTLYYIQTARKPELALQVAENAAKANNNSPAFLDILGQAQLGAGQKKDAIDTYTNLVNRQPNVAEAWYRLAWAQRVSGDLNAALKSMQKSARLAPNYLDARIGLAGIYAVLGQQENALKETREIQTLYPKAATGYNLEAELAARFKRPELALQALSRAQQSAPSADTTATYHLALIRSGNDKQAEQLAQQWLKAHPADSEFRIYLAGVLLQKQLVKQAISQYELALKATPNNVKALNNLAAVLQDLQHADALSYAQRAYSLMPTNPVIMDTYGWSLYQQGKVNEALPLLKEAAQALPTNPSVQYHWAYALAKTGQSAAARSLISKILATQQNFSEREKAIALLKTL